MDPSDVTFAIGIPHTPWIPERVASYRRLLGALGVEGDAVAARTFADRAPNHVWSGDMWRWGAEQRASHFVTLQDDAMVAPNFWRALRAMVAAVPDEVIGLEVAHKATKALALARRRWFTTADCLIGVGYVLPTGLLQDFLRWRATALKPGALERVSEDTLVALWCLVTGRRIWHPIPTLIDHDTGIASTYGNDSHPNRRPEVTWRAHAGPATDLEDVSFWIDTPEVPHLGRFYESTPGLALEHVEGFTREDYARAMADNGLAELRRLTYAVRGVTNEPPKARILVCTPTLGGTHPSYNASIWRLSVANTIDFDLAFEVVSAWQWTQDLVRVRSRFVRAFLEETDATHLLFVDSDVSFEPALVQGMLAVGRDYVAAPYPKRGRIDFEAVARDDGRPPEARAYSYALRTEGCSGRVDEAGCVEVAGVGLGCTLLSRSCLERMVAHYREPPPVDVTDLVARLRGIDNGQGLLVADDATAGIVREAVDRGRKAGGGLSFVDVYGGRKHPTVALFDLTIQGTDLLSEDHALASRWRAMGGKVWLYLGKGAPATHHGEHAYRGILESLGISRVET